MTLLFVSLSHNRVLKEDNAFSYGEGKQLQNSIFSYFVSIYL